MYLIFLFDTCKKYQKLQLLVLGGESTAGGIIGIVQKSINPERNTLPTDTDACIASHKHQPLGTCEFD